MWDPPADHPVRRLFAGYTEHTFQNSLGVADPPLIDYVAHLLSRFLHCDALYRLRDAAGRRLDQVADMLIEAAAFPAGATGREYHRHIGDFSLFWAGVYPEAVHRHRRRGDTKDALIDYCEQGKRSYYLASQWDDDPYADEAPVLRRLSEQFELFAFGLHQVRREWEKTAAGPDAVWKLIH